MAREALKANKVYRVFGENWLLKDGDMIIPSKDGSLATPNGIIKPDMVEAALSGVTVSIDCSKKVKSGRGNLRVSDRK